jgi:hypothetical protein
MAAIAATLLTVRRRIHSFNGTIQSEHSLIG